MHTLALSFGGGVGRQVAGEQGDGGYVETTSGGRPAPLRQVYLWEINFDSNS